MKNRKTVKTMNFKVQRTPKLYTKGHNKIGNDTRERAVITEKKFKIQFQIRIY